MPGPKTHDIFYKEVKPLLTDKTLSGFPNYDKYRIFAQGHDFLIYHDFYKIFTFDKLNNNVEDSKKLQEFKFQEFVYNYLNEANKTGAIEDEQVRSFIGPGYVLHHILDAYTHPQIIYYSGDHERDPKNKTWMHGIVENLLDIYMMKTKENKDPKTYDVSKDFNIENLKIEKYLLETLNKSLKGTYDIENGGKDFYESFYQVELFMKVFKYDPIGFKKIIFDIVDPLFKGSSSFSYHRDYKAAEEFLNNEHSIWLNPIDDCIQSYESFMDLYNKALVDGAEIVNKLESVCQTGIINQDEIYSIIPNVASTHGLECGQKCKIKNKKIR